KQVFFGATVTYAREDNSEQTVTLVGVDEANMQKGKISWLSPVARALMKASQGDSVELRTPAGLESVEVLEISYGSSDDIQFAKTALKNSSKSQKKISKNKPAPRKSKS